MSEKEKSRSSLSRTSLYKMNKTASLRLEQVLKQNQQMNGERPTSSGRLDRLKLSKVSVVSSKNSIGSSKYSIASGSRRNIPRSTQHRTTKSKSREYSENDTVSPVHSQRRVSIASSGRVQRKKPHPSRSKRNKKKRESDYNLIQKESSGSRMNAHILARKQMTPSYVSGSSEMTVVGEGRPIEITSSRIFPQAAAPTKSVHRLTENQNKNSHRVMNYINQSIFDDPIAVNLMKQSGSNASKRIITGLGQKKVDSMETLIRNKTVKQTVTTVPLEVSKMGKDTLKDSLKAGTVEKPVTLKASQPKIISKDQNVDRPSVSEVKEPPKKRAKSPNSKIPEESKTSMTSSVSLSKSSKSVIESTSNVRLANNVKEGKDKKLRSALKSSPSQLDAASSSDVMHSRSSISVPEADKKPKKVSILEGIDSLEELSGVITHLEREKTLEAIRRLEEVAKVKRHELAETRRKMRESLEEEIEINKKLERIVGKMKIIRMAGEDAAKILGLENQVKTSSTKKVKTPDKKKK